MRSGDPHSYVCCLPVHQDGSCNGLQHYAALGRDAAGGAAVNLTPSDRPQDVYTDVLKLVCSMSTPVLCVWGVWLARCCWRWAPVPAVRDSAAALLPQVKQVLVKHMGPPPPGADEKTLAQWANYKAMAELLIGKLERCGCALPHTNPVRPSPRL